MSMLGLSPTGSGKTGAFTLVSLQQVDPAVKGTQVLCLAPTRILAESIKRVYDSLAANSGITCVALVGGGERYERGQLNHHVVIATPQRANDLLKKRILEVSKLRVFIVDEVDRTVARYSQMVKAIIEAARRAQKGYVGDIAIPLRARAGVVDVNDVTVLVTSLPVRSILASPYHYVDSSPPLSLSLPLPLPIHLLTTAPTRYHKFCFSRPPSQRPSTEPT